MSGCINQVLNFLIGLLILFVLLGVALGDEGAADAIDHALAPVESGLETYLCQLLADNPEIQVDAQVAEGCR